MRKIYSLILFVLLPVIGIAQNGKFDVRLSYESSSCVPKKVAVLVEVKASSASNSFDMGDATMRFDYKLSDVTNPVLKTQHNFSSAATERDFNYQPLNISTAEADDDGILTLNITYAGLADGAKNVSTDWVSVATIEFDLEATDNCIDLKWHDNDRTPITGMSEIITPGAQPVAQAITGEQFIDLNYCVLFPLPTATISASPNSIIEGESSTLTVTLTEGTGNWSATLSDGSSVSNSSNTVSVSPTTTTTYTITSLTDKCLTNAFATNAPETTIGVIADEGPCQAAVLPTATISASPSSIIQGESSTLTVTLTEGTGDWSATLSDGSTVSNSLNTVSVSPATTTTYTITSLTDECLTNAFATNAPEITIGVIADEDPCQAAVLPTATLSASPSSIIQGQSSTLTVNLTGGTGNWSVTLSDGSSLSNSTSSVSEFVVFPTTTTTYSITSLSDECLTNAFATNAPEITIGVIADEDPCQAAVLPTATLSASPSSIIQGQSSTLTVNLTGGTGNWSVTLSDGSSLSNSTSSVSEFVVFPTTTTTYSITSLSDECLTNAFATNAPETTIGVIADEGPCQAAVLPTATISASPSSIIQGESSTLTVTLTEGTGDWSATLSDGSSVSNSSNTVSVSPTTTTTYTITSLIDECLTNAFATNAPETTIGVIADEGPCQAAVLPTATISASPSSIIQGESSTLTVTLTEGTGDWSATLSDGSSVSNSSNTVSVSPATTTTYTITSLTDECLTNAFATNAPETTIGVLPDENCTPQPCLPIAFKIIKK